jgi:predicted HTH transcriptional regulator
MKLRFSGDICLNEEDASFEAILARNGVPLSLWESYSSFANSFGGTIVLGLEKTEDGKLLARGITDAEQMVKEIFDAVNNPQKVSYNVLKSDDVRIVEQNGKRLIEISVPRADRHNCPIYINDRIIGGTFRRNGPNDYHCTKPEIVGMMRENVDAPPDTHILDDFCMEDIDGGTLSRYRSFLSAGDKEHIWNTLQDEEFLRRIGAAKKSRDGELHPTLAGLLMFGNEYRIVDEVPDYKLDYIEYKKSGAELEHRIVSDDGRWTGNVFDFFLNVGDRFWASTGDAFRLAGNVDANKAIRESIINALVHADYLGQAGIRIEVRHNIVVIRNSGLFRTPIREAEEGGCSDLRNPIMAKMFSLIGLSERAGNGLHDIVRTWKERGFEPPLIEESLSPPAVKMTLSMRVDSKTKAIADEEKVLMLMEEDGRISIEKISQKTGLSKSKTETVVKKLKESGRLERTGGKRDGRWIVQINPERK